MDKIKLMNRLVLCLLLSLLAAATYAQESYWNKTDEQLSKLYRQLHSAERFEEQTALVEQMAGLACLSPDAHVRKVWTSVMQNIPRRYFSEASKRVIREALNKDALVTNSIVFLAGYLGMREERQRLAQLAEREGDKASYRGVSWAAQLTLGRFGDEAWSAAAVKRIEAEKNMILKAAELSEHLAYLNRPEAMALLIDMAQSEEYYVDGFDYGIDGGLIPRRTYYRGYVLPILQEKVRNFPPKGATFQEIKDWAASTPIVIDEEAFVPIRDR
jgi:hypothetical protein